MTELQDTIFLYQKDFSEQGGDRYFLYYEDQLKEVSAQELVQIQTRLVTHDFWLIAPSIQRAVAKLPNDIVDIFEIDRAISGLKTVIRSSDRTDLKAAIINLLGSSIDVDTYTDMYYRKTKLDMDVYRSMGTTLLQLWSKLLSMAQSGKEYARYFEIESKVFNYLWRCAAKGIRLDLDALRVHKKNIENEYFSALKDFGTKFDQAFEMPSDTVIEKHLLAQNFDLSGASIDYILGFLPIADNYGLDLKALRKIYRSRRILADMPLSTRRTFPIVDVAGTVTSRIIYRNPALQNLAKRYRNIFIADEGMSLGYIDYAQFEVGVMALLSGDKIMRELYESGDLYARVAEEIFESVDRRKDAKKLFLSFAYGMSLKQLADAAAAEGATRHKATVFFKKFETFEKWRTEVAVIYLRDGKIGTSFGNQASRTQTGDLSPKERRSCVSQVVQGTASLIFKKALIAISEEPSVEVLLPMHDAIFFQYCNGYELVKVQQIFEKTFENHFEGVIKAKATLGVFAG